MLPYHRLKNVSGALHERRHLFSDPRFLVVALACALLVMFIAMGSRDAAAPTRLTATTWNVAAINNNPFEYWLTIPGDQAYADLMSKVEALMKNPGAKNILVSEVFSEDMARRLFKEMRALKWEGVDAVEELWRVDWAKRRVVSQFLRDADIGRKRLVSMPDRITNTMAAGRSAVYRPTTVNCYGETLTSLQDWYARWLKFMFHTPVGAAGKTPAEQLGRIERAKYPALTPEEERISIPLQTLVLCLFDAIQVRMLNTLVGVEPWQQLRARICGALNLRKVQGIVDIVKRRFADSDVVFVQEAGAALIDEAARQLAFHVVAPAARSKSDQNSLVLLNRAVFQTDNVQDVTAEVMALLKDQKGVAAGDLLAVVATDLWNRRFLLCSFHGDTNGLQTVPVATAVQQWASAQPSLRLLFGLDANAYAQGEPGETLDVLDFAAAYVRLGLNSCWGKKPDPRVHTTRNARTYMQPQLSKAASQSEIDAKGDCNPKDFVLFWDSQFAPEAAQRDNTGEGRYDDAVVFPTLSFPSDHAALTAVVREL